MKKMINKKIVNTEKMTEICGRTSHRSRSNNPIGWETIYRSPDGVYYLRTCGGNDISAPDDDIEQIGDFAALIGWIDESWDKNAKLIEHIEQKQAV